MTLLASSRAALPLHLVRPGGHTKLKLTKPQTAFLKASGFTGKAGQLALLSADDGALAGAVFVLPEEGGDSFAAGRLPYDLPEGAYAIAAGSAGEMADHALAFALGSYSFTRYRKASRKPAQLVVSDAAIRARATLLAEAMFFGRDLINTPANDMTPSALAKAALDLAKSFKAKAKVTVGDALLKANFPLIHAVGRASVEAPRLVDFTWGNAADPKVTLVGKGVCFDTGGLDIKPSASMLMMKKDMGGAATALTAARMIMAAKLPVRLRVLVPIVENAVSGNSFRASDVIPSRKGLTVEIGNTDAEGRLILADALALACEEKPDLLMNFATLTGAARVALGPDLPPFYTLDEGLAEEITIAAKTAHDPTWRLPLWPAYDRMLDSKIADLSSTGSGGMAGSITAALFLKRFVAPGIAHAHFDMFAWNPSTKPGRPEGGEPQIARLVFQLVERRVSAKRKGRA